MIGTEFLETSKSLNLSGLVKEVNSGSSGPTFPRGVKKKGWGVEPSDHPEGTQRRQTQGPLLLRVTVGTDDLESLGVGG